MTKIKKYKVNTNVFWKWLGRSIQGRIVSVHTEPIAKTIKGKTIKRNGSEKNPAYVVESEAGNLALKLHSELAEPKSESAPRPKIFSKN